MTEDQTTLAVPRGLMFKLIEMLLILVLATGGGYAGASSQVNPTDYALLEREVSAMKETIADLKASVQSLERAVELGTRDRFTRNDAAASALDAKAEHDAIKDRITRLERMHPEIFGRP